MKRYIPYVALCLMLIGGLVWAIPPMPPGSGGGVATTDFDTSAEFFTILTDEVGSGSVVGATAPTFVTSVGLPNTITSAGTVTWTMVDNQNAAIAFRAEGANDILKLTTTDSGPGATVTGFFTVDGVVTATGFVGNITGDVTGNADSASALADYSVMFDGAMTDGHLVKYDSTSGLLQDAGAQVTDNSTASHFLYKNSDGQVENATTTGSGTTMVLATSPVIATPAITQLEVYIDCNGSEYPYTYCTSGNASTLTPVYVSRTLINSYGRGEEQTVTLPAAASGYTFIAIVGTQHNSAWKIQSAGSDTITWSSGGTDTTGKTYFQETNQAVGSRVSCTTYKSGESAWTWLCGSVTGTWVTD